MPAVAPSVNRTFCQVLEVVYSLPVMPCDNCQNPARRFATATRVAIDVHLDCPTLLQVAVSVHYCSSCHHYFRAQAPFLRRNAIYTNRVIDKAVQSVYQDGLAMRRVSERLARDFWVCPSEATIRNWCRAYGEGFDFEADYQSWVVSEFSGILCVDEVYQGQLALLLAADPAAPEGDRLIGYQLVHGTVEAADVGRFLSHLRDVGIEPDEVITDGSKLYPTVLTQVWPTAAHQLCLFHAIRHVTQAVMKVINATRRELPHPPRASVTRDGGQLRPCPPGDDLSDPATQRWYWRQLQRHTQITAVHALAQQGLAQRAIARETGHHRDTIRRWLRQPISPLPENMPPDLPESASLSAPLQRQARKRALKREVHALRKQGLSYSAIAGQVGVHRVTAKSWLEKEPPPVETVASAEPLDAYPPPTPWSSWDEVRQVGESLREHRFLLLRRPANLDGDEQGIVTSLLTSPAGVRLRVAHSFLMDWYDLWTDEDGERRSLFDTRARYEAWRTSTEYRAIPQLRRIQDGMTEGKYEQLSQFLRHPEWEATNNGAERVARAFRHQQAPHFNLRTSTSIENAINVRARLRKEAATRSPHLPPPQCQRGRWRRPGHAMPATLI